VQKNNKTHFRGIDFLRFIAAFSIVLYHYSVTFQNKFAKPIKMMLHNLGIGVDLFFIISGFLIVYLLIVEKERLNTIALFKFYGRRILRIFPVYYLVVGIAYLLYHNTNPEIQFSKFLFFLSNFWMIDINGWTVSPLIPLWSICIEEHFYLVIPLLLTFLPQKAFPILFYTIILISIVFRIYITETVEFNWMSIYCHTLSKCDMLAAGGLMAYYFQSKKTTINFSNYVLFGTTVFLITMMTFVDSADYSTWYFAAFRKYIFSIPLLLLFYIIVLQPEKNPLIKFLINIRIVNYLGKISYGLYMYHNLVPGLTIGIIKNYPILTFLINILFTIIIATVSYEFFEKQFLKLKTKFEV
jgi:peptidoglycan/LPS O-acetylase OafA/YrhL